MVQKSVVRLFLISIFTALSIFAQASTLIQETADSTIVTSESTIVSSENDQLIIQLKKSTYEVNDPMIGTDERAPYEALTQEDKIGFNENRKMFLTQAAKALQVLKYGFGIGSVVKDKVSYRLQSYQDRQFQRQMRSMPETAQQDYKTAHDQAIGPIEAERQKRLALTLKERSDSIIQAALISLDQKLWSQAALFAKSNEFGFILGAGVEALGGVQGKGGWGGIFDFAISIGYNREEKAVAIQVLRDIETFQDTMMKAVFIAGATGHAGMYIANQKRGSLEHIGSNFYPPMIPGYSSTTNDSFATGASSGLTWPPSPLGDLLTYTTKLNQKALLRITVSPTYKGFIRIETGIGKDTFKFLLEPLKVALNRIKVKVGLAYSCSRAHAI